MIQSMILCQREGRYDPKNLEGFLSVLDRRLYDGGNGGVVFRTSHNMKFKNYAAKDA